MKILLLLFLTFNILANTNNEINNKPLVERYILDELKDLRITQAEFKANVAKQIAENKVKTTDRVVEYTTSTLNNMFYIMTIAASLLVLLGWRSINDVKNSINETINKRLDSITHKYEERLSDMEKKIKLRSDEIIANQEEISNTNMVHALWMRAGLEKSNREKIKIYDQILSIKTNDVEALTYKADTLLDIDKTALALELANQAIEIDANYSLAYWQRACANAELGLNEEAILDIRKAISISNPLIDKIKDEMHFAKLHEEEEFKNLINIK